MDVRLLRPDEAHAALQLRVAAFTSAMHVDPDDVADDYVPDDHRLVAVEGDRVVGHAAAWPFGQSFGGRVVPMGGVGGVAVAPDRRGRGIGSALLASLLELMADRGLVVSSLYPSTSAPYRSWGWEVAGEHVRRRVRTRDLLDLPAAGDDVVLDAFEPDDLDEVVALHDGITATEPGGLVGGRRWHARALLPDPDEPEMPIVARRGDAIVGLSLATKTSAEPGDGHSAYGLRVLRLVAIDHQVERALWRNLGHHYSVAETTTFNSRPAEPLLFQLPLGLHLPPPTSQHWMTRLVDVPAALAARGWPPLSARVELAITDRRVPANDGAVVLEADDGEVAVTPGGSGSVALDIGALSTIYTGFASPSAMARTGRLTGADADELALLDHLFAVPAPFLRDYF
ncbi:GNAT family N-acetyltransferase [Salsipaludibacter albus]|uniref:GNAT family N-acetyltransferase n=1 Tax=Salsipaludibacter albus TaxID=2849650 RepID=UPI001EE44CFA|nr:GNAT family N-acetyltransferase [Salsipaludibacter albus]